MADEQHEPLGRVFRRHKGRWRHVHWPTSTVGGRLERVGPPGVWREATYHGLDDAEGNA